MALLASEIARVKYELGYNVLSVGAEPYIGVLAIFDNVIKPFTTAGASTTSATPTTAAVAPTPATLTLASATGITAGDVLVVDVDSRQERATVQHVVGSDVTLLLSLDHSGTYPVTVEGGESIIRDLLKNLIEIGSGLNGSKSALKSTISRLGLKKVDDVEFFGGGNTLASQGLDPMSQLLKLREYWRDELAAVLGLVRLNGRSGSGGADVSVY